jgi:hypothetical protein
LRFARLQLRLARAPRPIPAAATRALGAEAAAALPSGLVATTCTRSWRPMSSLPGTYALAAAPVMSDHVPRRSRCQR